MADTGMFYTVIGNSCQCDLWPGNPQENRGGNGKLIRLLPSHHIRKPVQIF